MARALDRNRFQVHVGCLRAGGIRAHEIEAAKIPLTTFPLRSFWSPSGFYRSVRALRRYVRQHGIQVVHGFDLPTCLLIGLAARWLRPAVVLTSQRYHQRQATTPVARIGVQISHRLADGIVVNCEAMREHLVVDERQRRDRIHLCYNGLDTRRFRRITAPSVGVAPEGALVVGTVCVLRPEKDLSTLLRAFAACQAEDARLFLLVVGDGPERGRLELEAARLGISSRCRFQPGVADVVPFLSLMDVFVLPSRFEGLSNALLEAMACGCACIASQVGGTPELVQHGETGFLFDSGDVPGLVGFLRRLIGDPALRRRLGEQAVERIRTGFTVETAAARLGAIYEEYMASRA